MFTPCPPGPDDRENRHDSSDSGIVSPEPTRRPGRWAAGMDPSSSTASVIRTEVAAAYYADSRTSPTGTCLSNMPLEMRVGGSDEA